MSRRKLFFLVLWAYALGPVLAAGFGFPDRRGPRIYPRFYHSFVFSLSHEAFNNGEKARVPFDRDRPLFYGMERPLNERAGRLLPSDE